MPHPDAAPSRRLPTKEQARLVQERAREILDGWEASGLPPLAAIEVGPVRLEFRQGAKAESQGDDRWQGEPFG